MEVSVEKLRTALTLVGPAVPKKPSLEVLKCIRLGEGKVIATDLETAITIAGVGSPDDAPLCLPYRLLESFLSSVPGRETLLITPQDGKADLSAGRSRATLGIKAAQDYPPIPNPEPEHVAAVDGDALVWALTAVQYCCAAKDDTRPVLQTVCLTLGENPEAAAADGFRLAWEPLHSRLPGEGNLLIPSGAVHVLDYLWRHAPKPPSVEGASLVDIARAKRLVRLAYTKRTLRVDFGEVSLITTLTAGTFPNYHQLIPAPGSSAVTFNAEDLWRALRGMQKVAQEGSGIIRLFWGDGELKAEAKAEDIGVLATAVPAASTAPGRIAFNLKYLQAYLRDKVDNVTLSCNAPSSPGLFSYHDIARFLLMPMHCQWGDEPAAAPAAEAQEPETQDGIQEDPQEGSDQEATEGPEEAE